MPRYIEAEALLVSIGFDVKMFGQLRPDAHRFVKAVYDAPTADVEEVRHGEWKRHSAYGKLQCTECGILISTDASAFKNYCPNCGTDMR